MLKKLTCCVWCHVVWQICTNISEKPFASVFSPLRVQAAVAVKYWYLFIRLKGMTYQKTFYYIVFVIEPQRDHINIVICDHHYCVCHKPEWTVKSAKGKQTRKTVDQFWAKIARGWSSCFFFQYFIKCEKCVAFIMRFVNC